MDTQFIQIPHAVWTNLKIYPEVARLEQEVGLLNDLIEAFVLEQKNITCEINSPFKEFFTKRLKKVQEKFTFTLVYSEWSVTKNNADIILAPESDISFFKKISFNGKFLYLSQAVYNLFEKHFWYYFEENVFNYNNLVCLSMIVKDAGPGFEDVLTQNLPFFDRWCIIDTGSTDNTQEIIKRVLKNKKGMLYTEPFVNFRESRNKALELAGHTCKFIIILDDTYVLKGNLTKFLNEVRGDTWSDSFSLLIQSNDTEYYSNRIIKSESSLRYIHTIHEVITDQNNINITIPQEEAFIFDVRSDYMEQRTTNRKQLDLKFLFQELEQTPDNPRILYYIAQTYGCINDEQSKVKYFEKRIKFEGYIQEQIDTLFELARTYNFKINPDPFEYYKLDTKLSQSQWDRCEELYLKAYSLDTSRPDSLYFIGIHYYLEQNYLKCYNYFKKAFEVGYPIGSQYSLKPTLSYYFLPRFLTEVCYYLEDYKLGLSSAELFLTKNNEETETKILMNNWYNIHKNLSLMPTPSSPKKDYKIFCIVTDGGWEPWTGKDIETKGLGGSETWVIETARNLQEQFNVVVFCNTTKPEMYNGVGYNPVSMFHEFIATTEVEYCVISRFVEYVPVAIKGHAKNISIIFHDLLPPNIIIPTTTKIKWLCGLTQWHAEYIKQVFPQFEVKYSNYGIDEFKFNEKKREKVINSFIYSSFPNRGLIVLLKMWMSIKESFPDATLNIYCNLEHDWVNKVAPVMMSEIKNLVSQPGITNHGWVTKQVLAKAWELSEYWLYPCIFEETFCLTAFEAAISCTCVITNGLAALSESAKNGVVVEGDPLTDDWQIRCLAKLKNIVKSTNLKRTLVEKNYNWVKEFTWKKQTDKFYNLFNQK